MTANGNITAKYIRGLNLIASADANGANIRYYLYNAHGDTTQLTDSAGNVIINYDYDAFGNEKNPSASDTNPFRYCGEYYDKETATYYLRARYYQPGIGRFTQEDSVRDGLNWYVYCLNNPILYKDPSGHENENDMTEFGPNSPVYYKLVKIGDMWRATDDTKLRESYKREADLLRGLARFARQHNIWDDAIVNSYNLIIEYDSTICSQSNEIGVPKAYIAAIIFRETATANILDEFRDARYHIFGDSSFGLGQIYIETAQDAEESYYGTVQYPDKDEMKKRLEDDITNIHYIALVLKAKAKYCGIALTTNYDLMNAPTIFTAYNGVNTSDASKQTQGAIDYGKYVTAYSIVLRDFYSNGGKYR